MIESETLELLEWHRLCQHLSTFAATKLGAVATRHLPIPTTKTETLELLAQTQEVEKLEANLDAKWSFDGIEDIGESLERAKLGGILIGEELLKIATTLAGMRRLRRVIDNQEDLPVLTELVANIRTYPEIEQDIHHCIDDRGEVADRASPELAAIRSKVKSIRDKIYQTLHKIIQRQSGALQENVITQRGDRFVLAVKASCKDQISGIIHDTSSTGVTFYIEPHSIVQLGNQLRQTQRQEQREVEKILSSLTTKVADAILDLEHLLATATKLDLATARIRYSLWLGGNLPRFIEAETTTLRELRHPLLVWQYKHEQASEVIPINVQINPHIRVVAITGPNTGGKTVTLKTIGLTALMAKIGLYIPAKEPVELPWFEQILTDIGDEQSIEQSLSTFSGHIRRIIRIIEAINQKPEHYHSLILLDEIGAGTDPAEGTALAIALLQYLANHAQLTIATTHYGELKALKYQDARFENASVEFDEVSLKPTYRLIWGIPGRSNALIIAQRLGLKQDIVEDAKQLVGKNSVEVNEIIAALEAQRQEQETKAKQAGKLLAESEKFYTEITTKALDLQERERDLKLSQQQEVQKAIALAKTEISQVIRDFQNSLKTAQDNQKATESLNQIAQNYTPKPEELKRTIIKGYKPKVGDRVRLLNLGGQIGEVLTLPDEEGKITVRFGIMKTSISLEDIESLDGKKSEVIVNKPQSTVKNVTVSNTPKQVISIRTSNNTIDIRGKRVNDSEIEIDQAISKVIDSGVLWVIHGKGTGRLREGIREYLKNHPLIAKFEDAPANEGGTGATIAYLK